MLIKSTLIFVDMYNGALLSLGKIPLNKALSSTLRKISYLLSYFLIDNSLHNGIIKLDNYFCYYYSGGSL